MIEVYVQAAPVAQPRQRHRVAMISGRPVAQSYMPKSHAVHAFKGAVQGAFQAETEVEQDASRQFNLILHAEDQEDAR